MFLRRTDSDTSTPDGDIAKIDNFTQKSGFLEIVCNLTLYNSAKYYPINTPFEII